MLKLANNLFLQMSCEYWPTYWSQSVLGILFRYIFCMNRVAEKMSRLTCINKYELGKLGITREINTDEQF